MILATPRKKRAGEVLIENLAYFIAIQCRVPALAEGGTGVAKSQFMRALAAALNYKFYSLIGSLHAPEDFGGIPFPVFDEKHAELLPMKWVRRVADPFWFLFFDEVTTIPQSVRPVTLSMLSERVIGEVEMHPTTIMCGACNPPELAPNAAPLEPSVLNRFYHHKWVVPLTTWLEGMKNDQNFPVPNIPVLPEGWTAHRGKWSALFAKFIEAKPSMIERVLKADSVDKSFQSPRALQKAALLMAGAESIDAPVEVYSELMNGMVGSEFATEFFAYLSTVELYDPEEIVAGKAKVKWDKRRFDVIACLPSAVLGAIRHKNDPDRYGHACDFFVELCQHEADLALYPLAELMKMKPQGYRFSHQVATTYADILAQLEATT